MRQLAVPVLVLTLAVAAGVVFLALRPQSWWPQVTAAITGVVGSSPSKRAATAEKPNPFERKESAHRNSSHPISVTVETLPQSSVPGPTEIAAARYPFPVAEKILAGTAKSAVLALFGPPNTTVTGADVGQLRERLIYVDRATARKTLVYLVNGNVVSAETGGL